MQMFTVELPLSLWSFHLVFILRQGLLLDLELTDQGRLVCQQAPRILPPLPPEHWDYKYMVL